MQKQKRHRLWSRPRREQFAGAARVTRTAWTIVKEALLACYSLFIHVRVIEPSARFATHRVALPLRRSFIVAANHLTGADSLVLQIALKTRLFFVTWARWLAGRFSSFFMSNLCDSVPVEDGTGVENVAGVRKCLATLDSGGSVGIYPEGRLNRQGRVESLHDGAAYLAARTGTPILPVYVRNLKLGPEPYSLPWLNEAWEGFFSVVGNLLNTEIEVVLGEPIEPRAVVASHHALHDEIDRLNLELRRQFDQLAAAR
jgi:1-acyl-sn-glycerol-3-phosphate acyltransferase